MRLLLLPLGIDRSLLLVTWLLILLLLGILLETWLLVGWLSLHEWLLLLLASISLELLLWELLTSVALHCLLLYNLGWIKHR